MLERKLTSLKMYAGKTVGKMVALESTEQLISRSIILFSYILLHIFVMWQF